MNGGQFGSRDYFAREAANLCAGLTQKQRDVLVLASKGIEQRHIAIALDLAVSTVRQRQREIFDALDVETVVEAAVIAAKAGIA
jgi:DNA-binding NarL/FixJ family response regulator